MEQKIMGWKTRGMNQDLSVSAFNNEFSFENMNLRLSTNDGNTQMSWVNEKGTKLMTLDIENSLSISEEHDTSIGGIPIGTAIINHKLVLFTTMHPSKGFGKPDFIYVLEYSDSQQTTLKGKLLYNGNLNFNSNYPLETLVSYEAEHIQKVYWTDGFNQPRMINIAASDSKLKKWNSTTDGSVDTFFDFVPSFSNNEEVVITQNTTSGGIFAPGVIQYAFTYINKYGQESNLVYVSPLYYLSHYDRGASPEGVGAYERVTSSFRIELHNLDDNFDYVRLYSIQRTSLDLEPFVKHLDDLPISGTTNAELFSREIIYSSDADLTLPVDAKGKILTAEVRNGSYSVTVTPMSGTTGYSNDSDFSFVGTQSNGTWQEFLTLQELINLTLGINSTLSQDKLEGLYYYGIDITQDVYSYIVDLANKNHYSNWRLKVNESSFSSNQLEGTSIIYAYDSQKWYFTKNVVVENEIRNDVEGGNFITYIDNGTTGSTMDPTELLFVGGKEITALTMSDKDGTLFMGNLEQKNALVNSIQEYFDKHKPNIQFVNTNTSKRIQLKKSTGVYTYTHSLNLGNRRQITSFKKGEEYRFGFQLQKKTGEWLEPVYIGDETNSSLYPIQENEYIQLISAEAQIPVNAESGINTDLYMNIRPVIVYPSIGDRNILCQGVLNPTVFNSLDRIDNSPYSQASWYFRPILTNVSDNPDESDVEITGSTSVQHQVTPYSEQSSSSGPTEKMYVLVATVNNDSLDNIAKTGFISANDSYWEDKTDVNGNIYHVSDYVNTVEYSIYGYIILEEINQLSKKCAFLCSSRFATPEVDVRREWDDGTIEKTSHVYEGITNPIVSGSSKFSFYVGENMRSYRGLLYYVGEEGASSYIFYFDITDETGTKTYYKITFINKEGIVYRKIDGSSIEYRHYNALPNSEVKNKKSIEIQGAKNLYSSPYEEYDEGKIKNNTQFFIDQSIVTLNSPDIKFDAEVQNCNLEGFKLRVIGAIPITSSASGHFISSSAMLELSHNLAENNSTLSGVGDLKRNVWNNVPSSGGWHLVAEYLWNDAIIDTWKDGEKDSIFNQDDKTKSLNAATNYLIYPWHRSGPLNNDWRKEDEASSWIKVKKESNLLFSAKTLFTNSPVVYSDISAQVHLQENEFIENIRLPRQIDTSSEINYYSNIDKVLYNEEGFSIFAKGIIPARNYTTPISMKYKSDTHTIIALNSVDNINIPILPRYGNGINSYENPSGSHNTFWGDTNITFSQSTLSGLSLTGYGSFLWLGELYRDSISNKFGGNSKEAIRNNKWLVAGDTKKLSDAENGYISLEWTEGDTYYQRYDCLKTYAFTPEDTNQIVEILSFMCETHVNIDGRYDRNRGQIDNTDMHPTIFNLLNPVYSQKDNFFTSRQLDMEDVKELKYPNQIYYTKTKNSGADVDMWTNVTLANTLELDGDKGKISSLNRFNDAIIAFQDTGISQVLYNENTQISTTQGVPIEIANSGKVQGKRYLSDTIGCSNKWSISQTPAGLYFMDNHSKGIYLFNGQLQNLSLTGGFNAWCKQNIPLPGTIWSPRNFNDFTSHYDKKNQEVLFVNGNTALAYSEKFGAFTSFYSYENTPYFCNLDDTGLFIMFNDYKVPYGSGMYKKFRNLSMSTIWQHQTGEYCKFFNSDAPYWMTLVGNPEPQRDKVFTNLEFRATVDGDGKEVVTGSQQTKTGFEFYLPFDSLEVWNEYQHGVTALKNMKGHAAMMHHTPDKESSLKRKYRIWRCDVPRDNAPLNSDEGKNISRFKVRPLDRMRNPWVYLKLQKDATSADSSLPRVEIHDMMMKYFV